MQQPHYHTINGHLNIARKSRRPVSQVRFATTAFYLRCPNAEEYRYFFSFVHYIDEYPTCIKGINERRAICPTGFYIGKKVLVHIYEKYGEIYSTYDRDVKDKFVRLELDDTITDIRRIVQLLAVKVMYNMPYTSISRHNPPEQKPLFLLVKP
jgi:hypothetical protein